ncbi:hypothetical protein [Brucella pseudogrignonensis]|uniref:hypothetical protein n=1 Tax=Brucella pseudogrignonensis TaxID=419475 RepID=UPI000CFC4E5A|nr:hypothetical protein [Brucella pseudogrignonensis]MQP40927.1 hypothetical protein [Ochrobactrum sp. MYb237]PQZ40881.1 hypothetical protein CQ059_16650 [Brucella pseudogrignonensis]PRA40400.1 hypothetical protein CQ063_12505 [Brucella pseudogrignonensis]PRA68993.1 hypothetical protein CQ055_12390 [Brucella pseudogrignonensis]
MVDIAIVHQPELRALMMLDSLPEGCVLFPCTDESSWPHIRPGEFAVIDTTQRLPVHGELYLIKFGERKDQHHICMVRKKSDIQWSCKELPSDGWTVGSARNDEMQRIRQELERLHSDGMSRQQFISQMMLAQKITGAWAEGPYATEGQSYEHLCNCLIGTVIGIYQSDFETMREIG